AAALLGVAATMQPWMHGVVIGFALVLGMGLFIAAACALDQAPRLVASVRRPGGRAEAPGAPVPLAELAGVAPDASRERAPGVPLPLPGRAGSL
ncbi:MAG TPA: hypothetical protein VFX50_17200, partial [Gemmatimonadales bacterium]|nr:hypothetical protein [Gemmatimonadales bacterium]